MFKIYKINKGWLLTLALLFIVLITATGCGGNTDQSGAGDDQEGNGEIAGQTIRFVAANHDWTDKIKPLIPEFEKQTGVKVNLESYSENQLNTKLTTEFTSGVSTIDVFMTRPQIEGRVFSKNKWYEPLNDYINDPNKTPAEWDWNDFQEVYRKGNTDKDNNIFAIPLLSATQILYYRTDLFEKYNLEPPANYEELEAAAKKLNNPSEEVYGIVMRGMRGDISQFTPFLYNFGGDYIKDNKCAIDSPEAIQAIKFYGKMLHDYGPPGATNMGWPQVQALFASGKAAMLIDSGTLLPGFIASSKSNVADKMGFALIPAGPAGRHPWAISPWALAISSKSQHKEAAWEFVKWLSSKEVMKITSSQGVPQTRASIWSDSDIVNSLPSGFAETVLKTAEIGVPYQQPQMTSVTEAADVIGNVIVESIETGGQGDIEALAQEASNKVNALLANAGEGGL